MPEQFINRARWKLMAGGAVICLFQASKPWKNISYSTNSYVSFEKIPTLVNEFISTYASSNKQKKILGDYTEEEILI